MSAEDSLSLLERPWWHKEAACRGVGPLIFFVEYGDKPGHDEDAEPYTDEEVDIMHAQARNFCKGCTVREECDLQGRKEKYGIWNGRHACDRD